MKVDDHSMQPGPSHYATKAISNTHKRKAEKNISEFTLLLSSNKKNGLGFSICILSSVTLEK